MRVRYGGEVMAAAQYKEFLRKVIAEDEMWLIMKEGAVSVTYVGSSTCLPIWGTQESAEANLNEEWAGFDVKAISVGAFFVLVLPDFINDDVMIEMNVDIGFRKSVRAFEKDLRAEAEAQGFDIEAAIKEVEESVEDMETEECYERLIEDIAAEGGAWLLFNEDDGIVMVDAEEEDEGIIPVWDSYEKAYAMCCDEWEDCSPDFVSVIACLEELLPSLDEDGIKLLLTMNEEMGGLTISAADFAKDLEEALEAKYDDDDETEYIEESMGKKDNVIPFPKLS